MLCYLKTLNFKIVMVRWHEPPQEPCKESRLRQFMQDLCTRPKHCYCHFKFILLSFLLVYWFFFSSATSSSPSFSLPYLNCYSQAYHNCLDRHHHHFLILINSNIAISSPGYIIWQVFHRLQPCAIMQRSDSSC